jgi:uncharacterized coiled-coil DUF342 family protein
MRQTETETVEMLAQFEREREELRDRVEKERKEREELRERVEKLLNIIASLNIVNPSDQ